MECLYCHNKFASFRFWKSAQFCSQEHAEAYRSQALDRLMGEDLFESGEKLPLPLSEVLGLDEETQFEGPPRLNAAPDDGFDPALLDAAAPVSLGLDADLQSPLITPPPSNTHPTVEEILARSGTPDSGTSNEPFSLEGMPSSLQAGGDVRQQTAEEALEALRSLAQSTGPAAAEPDAGLEDVPPFPELEDEVAEAGPVGEALDLDADDAFAELRRIAATADDVEAQAEEASEVFDPAAPIASFSVLDSLTETPKPRPREAVPGLSRQTDDNEEAAFSDRDGEAEIPEPEVAYEVPEEIADVGFPQVLQTGSTDEGSTDEDPAEDGGDKVVSFPSQSDLRRKSSLGQANGSATSGPSLFDLEIQDELIDVDLDEMFRESPNFPMVAQVELDETLKASAVQQAVAELTRVMTPSEGREFAPRVSEALDLSRVIRPPAYDTQEPLGNGSAREPAAGSFTPAFPVGLLERMGVTPAGRTGQLVRSELFHKEPEVRGFPFAQDDSDTARSGDVRRAYYGQQDTA